MNNTMLSTTIEEMSGKTFDCSCGRKHHINIDKIRLGSGIISEIPEILSIFKGSKVLLVADTNTYKVAGLEVEKYLRDNFTLTKLVYTEKHLHPDAEALGRLLLAVEDGTGLILAVGSGTINDMCRFISHKTGIPYAVVGTAPSMDGYASIVSNILVDGIKTSISGVYPYAIIADISIMKEAPLHMLQSGLGDVLGKYTALCDWKLSNIMTGEYYCENIAQLVDSAVQKCVDNAPKLASRDPETVKSIIEALILTGICIGYVGTSRPAAGAEHNMAHFWEMEFIYNKCDYEGALHGNLVGVATGIVAAAYELLAEYKLSKELLDSRFKDFSYTKWESDIKCDFRSFADKIVALNKDSVCKTNETKWENACKILDNAESLEQVVYKMNPGRKNVENILKSAGAVYEPCNMWVDKELFKRGVFSSKDLRLRYSVFEMMETLGLLEEIAAKLITLYYPE